MFDNLFKIFVLLLVVINVIRDNCNIKFYKYF